MPPPYVVLEVERFCRPPGSGSARVRLLDSKARFIEIEAFGRVGGRGPSRIGSFLEAMGVGVRE
ncbi:MAG TPA: hypothetical protein ENK57_03415 [Polyangiaceae bacterium]|nr:hypothetical protein [Polyangiaceae bacterium]